MTRRGKRKKRNTSHANPPRSVEDFLSKPATFQTAWTRVTSVITRMRRGESLSQAAKELGVDPRTVVKKAKQAIKKLPNGRFRPSKTDSLLRVLRVPTEKGSVNVGLNSSRHASLLGSYWDAVQKYLRTGDETLLNKFKGRRVRDSRHGFIDLITDTQLLNRLGSAGVLSFESLYARVA